MQPATTDKGYYSTLSNNLSYLLKVGGCTIVAAPVLLLFIAAVKGAEMSAGDGAWIFIGFITGAFFLFPSLVLSFLAMIILAYVVPVVSKRKLLVVFLVPAIHIFSSSFLLRLNFHHTKDLAFSLAYAFCLMIFCFAWPLE